MVTKWRQGFRDVLPELALLQTYKNSEDRAEFSQNVTQKVYELRMYGLTMIYGSMRKSDARHGS